PRRIFWSEVLAVRQVQWSEQAEFLKSSFLVCSAWRHPNTCRISESKGKGWRFFEWFFSKNTTRPLLGEKPYCDRRSLMMTARRYSTTWKKIYELGASDDELDHAYAEMIATAIDVRVRKGITQTELAKRSGLTTSMISKIESQNSVPTIKTFLKYMRGLDLDWEFVYKQKKP
ncbi:helix-turn-helix domain-containing protein, partial [Afifella sp. IM 167]|uniref:helix-turn-helix domain-containing protein n=1 Tax=Afifella sp. IM 167 TaxID=2033586 RepID=UPI001CCB384D